MQQGCGFPVRRSLGGCSFNLAARRFCFSRTPILFQPDSSIEPSCGLAFCQAAVLAGRAAYDRVGTRSNENEAFGSRQQHIRVTVATDKYEPCSRIAHCR